jgi:hypothetical protein
MQPARRSGLPVQARCTPSVTRCLRGRPSCPRVAGTKQTSLGRLARSAFDPTSDIRRLGPASQKHLSSGVRGGAARPWMKRREFIAGSAAICACTILSQAAAASPWRIGQVFGGTPDTISFPELVRALFRLGYVDGKDVQVQTWYVTPNPEATKDAISSLLQKSTCSSCGEQSEELRHNYRTN